MSASNQNSEVFDPGAGCPPLVEPQRRDRLWFHRYTDIDDSHVLAPLIRSSIDDRLPSATELLHAIAAAGIFGLRTKATDYGSFTALTTGATERHP